MNKLDILKWISAMENTINNESDYYKRAELKTVHTYLRLNLELLLDLDATKEIK
jgi:hypothetical protein